MKLWVEGKTSAIECIQDGNTWVFSGPQRSSDSGLVMSGHGAPPRTSVFLIAFAREPYTSR